MDVYRPGTFVSQIDKVHCMSAAMQNMLNTIGPTVDRTAGTQREIAELARPLSTDTLDGGWGPRGWATGLERLGAGRYVVRVYSARAAALRAGVRALRATGRPVGILSWWGAHSWVLTGFAADADPARVPDATIYGYRIVDPWYPRVSSIWGAARPPDSLRTPAEMVHNLPAWVQPEGPYPQYDGRWVMIIPVGSDVPRLAPDGRHAAPV